jgi:hypothetical protein
MAAKESGPVEFVNQSGVDAGWTLGFERDGRELLVVAIKATYNIPTNGEEPTLAEEQLKLVKADEFTGEPGYSAPLRETDYSHRKLKCDVVLNGSAYAPGGVPRRSVEVSLRVGQMRKSFYVFGERRWQDLFLSVSEPELFTQTPISYDWAYGGADLNPDEPDKVATYVENPVGKGYHPIRRRSALVGELLPNTAEGRTPISEIKGRYRPMSFGPVGRNFFPRFKHAGTYDQNWLDNEAPFWPADFGYSYFQCSPEDQQVPFLQGGEYVELTNLTPEGFRQFHLPTRTMPVTFLPHRGPDIQQEAVCDTVLFEPDAGRFTMTWRAPLPLRRHMFELKQTIVGDLSYSWLSKRCAEAKGKTYYASLGELVAARQGRRRA